MAVARSHPALAQLPQQVAQAFLLLRVRLLRRFLRRRLAAARRHRRRRLGEFLPLLGASLALQLEGALLQSAHHHLGDLEAHL